MRFPSVVICVLLLSILAVDGPVEAGEKGGRKLFAGTLSEPSDARQRVCIPDWFRSPPKDGFVGVSKLCPSIQAAREQALDSAIAQILQAMGAEYRFFHESALSGSADSSRYHLREFMTFAGRWFIHSVQQNIRKLDIQQIQGGYICFLLVEACPEKLEELRRLTIGPKPGARVVKSATEGVLVEVRENNGVQVTFTDYEVEITTNNHRAGVITMFLWKVPESRTVKAGGTLPQKVTVKESSARITLPNPAPPKSLGSFFLGSRHSSRLFLRGHDEIGRPVSVPVSGF